MALQRLGCRKYCMQDIKVLTPGYSAQYRQLQQHCSWSAMEVVSRTSRYSPDTTDERWKLGKGGCHTTVEGSELQMTVKVLGSPFTDMATRRRYCEQGTNKVFAVKKMPRKYREAYDDLIGKEISALSRANALDTPRVVKCFGRAWCIPNDDCIILE